MASESAPEAGEKMTLNGSCHCGAIKFQVKDLDLSKVVKCNCTICNISGVISLMIGKDNLKVIPKDGDPQFVDYKNSRSIAIRELSYYSFTEITEKHQVFRHFCSICGIHCFLTGYVEAMGGAFACANLRTLNLKEHGKDIKDYTSPDRVLYYDGLADSFSARKSEPFPGGAW